MDYQEKTKLREVIQILQSLLTNRDDLSEGYKELKRQIAETMRKVETARNNITAPARKKRGRPYGSKNKPKEFMTISEFIRRSGMATSTVYYHIKNGKFNIVLVNGKKCLKRDEINSYLKGSK